MNRLERYIKNIVYGGTGIIAAGLYLIFFRNMTLGGAVGIIIGTVIIAASIIAQRGFKANTDKLKTEGFCVDADFETSERIKSTDPSDHLNNEWYYIIKCSWCDPSGTGHIYTDRILLHFDPSFELTHRKTVKVYIDRDNPSIYYMDLEFLKELDKRRM